MNYTLTLPDNYVPPPLPGGKQWVEALRSGLYQQCTGQLCDGTGYCCLGVLSKVQGRLIEKEPNFFVEGSKDAGCLTLSEDNPMCQYIKTSGRLPRQTHVQVEGDRIGICIELTALNDAGLTFPQIADIIEQVWACE